MEVELASYPVLDTNSSSLVSTTCLAKQCISLVNGKDGIGTSDCLVEPLPQHATEITRTTPVEQHASSCDVMERAITGEGSSEISRESTPFVTESMMAEEERLKHERVADDSSEHQVIDCSSHGW